MRRGIDGAARGQKLQAEGEHLGKSVAEIKGPCSLLSLVFCNKKEVGGGEGRHRGKARNPPGIKNVAPG